ncbi:haloacid dehalogenase superfamily protein, subfamily IA, variant 3 with third motif having DD or ED [Candidatus Nitrososphaera evergladensis SR1]|uniref:Haloacid dehalogenase superfamily protein, subfamily IA, variant 3 with third motif having DD or ED n=1 Tax=Candidatus Nitrososphaera evergladensis SR1 TaxID=1459636 RepID=A0A075MUS9_9ARCH|nr:HAD family phosphatase [Candidatus Nitrososphaera evergladensis]AIF84913.1 haloacid dehalogenase superfamily protein, subfamily IA, variant 3 with third motif having DD or ED [Candidatus Nitrososphaera evergladensis SR1]
MRGIIFDLDGVLVDSMPSHSQAWVQAFQNVANIQVEKRVIYVLEGMRGAELAEKILADHNSDASLAKKVIAEKDRLFKETKERPKAFEGVKEMIESLACAKAVVSGSNKHDVESVLDETIGKEKFDVIITADDIKRGKPDPLAFNTALSKLHVSAKDAAVVENAPLGVRAANNAGIQCYVALNNTLLLRSDFEGVIAKDRIFEKTSSLKGLLKEMCLRQ